MWLLLDEVKRRIDAGVTSCKFTAEQQAEFEARIASTSATGSPLLTIAGDQAEIAIKGVLTAQPDFFAAFFGGGNTVYSDIISALAEAEANDSIKQVTLAIDSPGGKVDGMFDAVDAIKNFSKPIKTVVSGMMASAAFALGASVSGEIVAAGRATMIGSVGVAVSMPVSDGVVTLTSTAAPKKRPDVRTEEGKAAVREQLDAIHGLYAEVIADGRGVSVETVNAEFGQGATLLADEALKRGMIDSVAGPSLKVVNPKPTASKGGAKVEAQNMDLNKLKAEHPDVYAAAVAEGEEKGVEQERKRAKAHLTLGEASGAIDIAVAAVKEGKDVDVEIQAEYTAAGMKRTMIEARDQDAEETDDATEGSVVTKTDDEKAKAVNNDVFGHAAEAFGVEIDV